MKTLIITLLLLITFSCSTTEVPSSEPKFSDSEVLLTNALLEKILSKESESIDCIDDTDEAELLQRTLSPIYESVQDELEATLDEENKLTDLIERCEQECTCNYIQDLVKEHQVDLPKKMKRNLMSRSSDERTNECMKKFADSFCKSKLFEKLQRDKDQFTFEE